jgi:hypothetical protein
LAGLGSDEEKGFGDGPQGNQDPAKAATMGPCRKHGKPPYLFTRENALCRF